MAETIIGGLIGLVIALALIALFAVIFQWLWNTTIPEVFGLKTLTFWQTIKILIIAGILFGGHRVVYMDVPTDPDTAPAATAAAAGSG
jgi:hypothetical protein